MFEYLEVVFWGVTTTVGAYLIYRAHKSNKLARKHPIEVSIFDFFVVLIFFVVKFSEIVPAQADCNF